MRFFRMAGLLIFFNIVLFLPSGAWTLIPVGSGPQPNTGFVESPSAQLNALQATVLPASILVVSVLLILGVMTYAPRSPSTARRRSKKITSPAQRTKAVATPLPACIDYTSRNQREVIGWELADAEQLRSLQPLELQGLLDRTNPFSDRIAQCIQAIHELQGTNTKAERKRTQLEERLKQLRLAPVLILQRGSLAEADQILGLTKSELEYIVPEIFQETLPALNQIMTPAKHSHVSYWEYTKRPKKRLPRRYK